MITPSVSILAQPSVAIVDDNADATARRKSQGIFELSVHG